MFIYEGKKWPVEFAYRQYDSGGGLGQSTCYIFYANAKALAGLLVWQPKNIGPENRKFCGSGARITGPALGNNMALIDQLGTSAKVVVVVGAYFGSKTTGQFNVLTTSVKKWANRGEKILKFGLRWKLVF